MFVATLRRPLLTSPRTLKGLLVRLSPFFPSAPQQQRQPGLHCVGTNTKAANMIIYKCRVSGDEMFSDIYKIITTDDGLLEVEGKIITRKVGEIDDSLIGGNASAEEVCEGTDSASESGPDIVLNHKLCSTPCFDKKGFVTYLKAYLKALKAKIEEEHPDCPDKVKEFQEEAQKAGKKMMNLVTTKKDLEFFTGESMNADGIIGFLDYRDDGVTPYMIYMKCGLELEKC